MKDTLLAKDLLNGVWEGDTATVKRAILNGADPNWIFNGYPILVHAVYTQNLEIMNILVSHGATQLSEALGFALEYGLGNMVWPLAFQGIVPKQYKVNEKFGEFPSRFAPSSIQYQH
ncbi:hypothetical protein M2475_000048 [Breznakia sp. PF5-3]|uniref:hypothetical protein n=1 Tax=unclassified Breznakia TaxID=2623764 RepID=UPI0024077411|nr:MULTISPECIES: hypothetical protein [unclassified Breznakia]MDL2276852.1 ankyrin repeat domain-containing protein [Breznakia sp. OttesenSCG-928-G09]MDF9823701.1 hypothetical protein [Breznakia sp. PM6-1]MDF9834499.1 hypothetical protein [Breznakia sp. PF5-3]MDF9837530.1 hypothetical protein [Breznakia sp. PFB2-8]MDF9859107.1 hypothetical protein [Breznakia sp. PH5-24]